MEIKIGIRQSWQVFIVRINYTRQKKKRTTTIFPLRSPFNT